MLHNRLYFISHTKSYNAVKGAFDCPYSGIGIHGIEVRNPSFLRRFHMKVVKHLLKCYFKHIFIILVASKRQTYRFKSSLHRILIPE